MYESKRYEAWLHTAFLRHDILTAFRFGKSRKKYKLSDLHPMEAERKRNGKITWIDFETAMGIYLKDMADGEKCKSR